VHTGENEKMEQIENSALEKEWFYESAGSKKGPVSLPELTELIKQGVIGYGNLVWRKGYPDWVKLENSELKSFLDDVSPPPIRGENVSNALVWIVAFVPLLGELARGFLIGVVYGYGSVEAFTAVLQGDFWWIHIVFNLTLTVWDSMNLKKGGTDTSEFGFWVWLVPVYLFKRAKALNQSLAYFWTWIAMFVISLLWG
jgi:hypothetical protein